MTPAEIKAAAPGATLRDDMVPGLQLRIFPQRRSWYLYFRTKAHVERRPKLGDYPIIPIAKARELARAMLVDVAAGKDPVADLTIERNAPTMVELCDKYMKEHAPKKKTKREDEKRIDSIVKPKLGTKRVKDVASDDIEDLRTRMVSVPIQFNRTRALLSKMFNLAEKWKYRPQGSNPTEHVDRYPERKRKRYFTREEAPAIAERLRHYADEYPEQVAFLWILIYSGARPIEIAAVMPDQVIDNAIVLDVHKTDQDGEPRVIHLPQQAMDVIAKLKKTRSGTLVGIKSPRHLWEKIIEDTKIANLRRYDLRHSFASMALDQDYTLEQIGQLLGHKSPETTKRYAHLMDEKAKAAVTKTAAALDEYMKPGLRVVEGGKR